MTWNFTEEYDYCFDEPTRIGHVAISNNNVILTFPEKIESETYQKLDQTVTFCLNHQLTFDFEMLPISTLNDFLSCKNMLYRCFYEYTILTQLNYYTSADFIPKYYKNLATTFENPHYYLACLENVNTTSIELLLKEDQIDTPQYPIHFQLFCGKQLLFCTKTSFPMLKAESVHFIVAFILYKLIKY